jgi:hypothetical protein
METGMHSKIRHMQIKTWVCTTDNGTKKLSQPLISRFMVMHLNEYSFSQFYEIAIKKLLAQFRVSSYHSYFYGQAVKVVDLITGIVKSDVSLPVLIYGFTHDIGTRQTALHPCGDGVICPIPPPSTPPNIHGLTEHK